MPTASDIIRRAMRIAGIIDGEQAMQATDAQDALDTLNAMLAEWHVARIGLPDYELPTLATALASDAADRDAIAYALALRISPEYGAELSGAAIAQGQQSMNLLRLRYFQPGSVAFDELPSTCASFNIVTGDY